MNATDGVTLHAFLTALAELDSSLPQELQREINQTGHIFSSQQTDAIALLGDLAKKHDQLNKLYHAARISLQQQYDNQERNKLFPPGKKNPTAAKPPKPLENITAPIPPKQLEKIASPIVMADNPQLAAKQELQKNRAKAQWFLNLLFQ